MNRAAVIEQIKATQVTLSKLLALLQSSEADKFVAHLPGAEAVSPSLRAPEQGEQGHRTRGHFELPGSAEPGLHG
jgi:hypothetical protein